MIFDVMVSKFRNYLSFENNFSIRKYVSDWCLCSFAPCLKPLINLC